MLKVLIPKCRQTEQRYILGVMLGEFLGLDFEIFEHNESHIEIRRFADNSVLSLNAEFFNKAEQAWLKLESMPVLPLANWVPQGDSINPSLIHKEIPILFGCAGLIKDDQHLHLNLDIFGSAFFMLSGYEELISSDRDSLDRFPATASVAYKAGFLDRPIVNEYLEILWCCFNSLWPELERKAHEGKNFITCDVDWPYQRSLNVFQKMVFQAGRQVLKEYAPHKALSTALKFAANKLGFYVGDEYRENISWIMDVNEKAKNKVAFYFIMHNTSSLDTVENFDAPKMRELFQEIYLRGHEIGIHPGYHCYKNPNNFTKTVETLRRVLEEEGIEQDLIGGRMHFLRWDMTKTPHLWENNGLDYDSTLMFADKVGFRCGTSYEFTMYDLVNNKTFRLKQRPLIIMESTVIADRYEGLGYSEKSMERFIELKQRSRAYGGTYTLLWHNSFLEKEQDKRFYTELIK